MKKIVIMLLMLMPMVGANATTMCAANDTVAVVLDPSINLMASSSYSADLGSWWASGAYGTVHGISACVNVGRGKSIGDTVARLTDTNNNETNLVVGSEKYGQYCWCRMTHPAVSLWAFRDAPGSVSGCVSNCASYCANSVRVNAPLRRGLFGSVRN